MIRITIFRTHNKWFNTQKELAEYLCIKNSSKKAIESRCRKLNYEIEWYE